MGSQAKQVQAAIMISIAAFGTVAYLNFVNFKPAGIPNNNEQVQGARTDNLGIPYPDNAVELSRGHTADGYQITLNVDISPEQVQEFYKNSFESRKWEIESQGEAGVFLSTKFKTKESDERVTITSSRQEKFDTTVVIIDIS